MVTWTSVGAGTLAVFVAWWILAAVRIRRRVPPTAPPLYPGAWLPVIGHGLAYLFDPIGFIGRVLERHPDGATLYLNGEYVALARTEAWARHFYRAPERQVSLYAAASRFFAPTLGGRVHAPRTHDDELLLGQIKRGLVAKGAASTSEVAAAVCRWGLRQAMACDSGGRSVTDLAVALPELIMEINTRVLFGRRRLSASGGDDRVGAVVAALVRQTNTNALLPRWVSALVTQGSTSARLRAFEAVLRRTVDREPTLEAGGGDGQHGLGHHLHHHHHHHRDHHDQGKSSTSILELLLDRAAREKAGAPPSSQRGLDGSDLTRPLTAVGLDFRNRCFGLLYAGSTTTKAASSCLYELMRRPALLSRARAEVDGAGMRSAIRDPGEFAARLEASKLPFLHAAILETLRLLTGPLSIRVAAAPFAHGPYTIPAGMMIGLSPYHDHHDAGVFDRPDEFLPERFLRGTPGNQLGAGSRVFFHGFGSGVHACPGRGLALLTAKAVLAYVLSAFDVVFADGSDAGGPEWNFAAVGVALPKRPVRIALTPRPPPNT